MFVLKNKQIVFHLGIVFKMRDVFVLSELFYWMLVLLISGQTEKKEAAEETTMFLTIITSNNKELTDFWTQGTD